MEVHIANPNEYEELRKICCETFGDEPSFVDALYEKLDATGFVLTDDGCVQSCLTVFQVGSYQECDIFASYAICTRPESRGKGYASTLTKAVRDEVIGQGYLSLICPAEKSLFSFYERLQYKPYFCVESNHAKLNDAIAVDVKSLCAHEYQQLRESYLQERSHIELSESFLDFVSSDCEDGYGLVSVNGEDAIAVVSSANNSTLDVQELLVNPALLAYSSEIAGELAMGLAKHYGCNEINYNCPVQISENGMRQGMIAGPTDSEMILWDMPYFGFPMK